MNSDPGTIESEYGVPIPGAILPEMQWSRTALKRLPPPGPLDFGAIFGRVAPLIVELGCGNGRFTLLSALARPDHDHLATDILPVVIRYATRRGNQRGLTNVRFAVRDAQTLVSRYLGRGGATEIHLYHPQPYHDPREAHKRLVTPRFLGDVHEALADGGRFFLQTDNPDYWGYMRRVLPVFFEFREQDGPWNDAPEGRSRREILARSRGLRVFRGECVKKGDLDETTRKKADRLPYPRFHSQGPWLELDEWEGES